VCAISNRKLNRIISNSKQFSDPTARSPTSLSSEDKDYNHPIAESGSALSQLSLQSRSSLLRRVARRPLRPYTARRILSPNDDPTRVTITPIDFDASSACSSTATNHSLIATTTFSLLSLDESQASYNREHNTVSEVSRSSAAPSLTEQFSKTSPDISCRSIGSDLVPLLHLPDNHSKISTQRASNSCPSNRPEDSFFARLRSDPSQSSAQTNSSYVPNLESRLTTPQEKSGSPIDTAIANARTPDDLFGISQSSHNFWTREPSSSHACPQAQISSQFYSPGSCEEINRETERQGGTVANGNEYDRPLTVYVGSNGSPSGPPAELRWLLLHFDPQNNQLFSATWDAILGDDERGNNDDVQVVWPNGERSAAVSIRYHRPTTDASMIAMKSP
jgi:hypothetical protein